jgi:Protein of unknown function (DUF3305)
VQPSRQVTVIMQRRVLNNRWVAHQWAALAVLEEAGTPGQTVDFEENGLLHRAFKGFALTLFRDEAEGYYLSTDTPEPGLFVHWRLEDDTAQPRPQFVTASYNEAGRLLDGGETVESVPMQPATLEWVREFVSAHYKPEPKKRKRPQSFLAPKDRARS